MAHLGGAALLLALLVAAYGTVAGFVAARTGRLAVLESARRAGYGVLLLVTTANVAMLAALLRDDFSLRYVAENSSRATPTFFKVLALWAADDGSLLLWNLVLAGYLAAVVWSYRRARPTILACALGVVSTVEVFYLALVNGPTRPFEVLSAVPLDGRGPPPLLQNHPLMAVHPPFLYLGFIGLTVPFGFAMAALLTGRSGPEWVAIARRWVLGVWCFLTVGLTLGALWSYSVLGWGGYWAWDPVENVALLPWLVATALLHSVMLQRRRGMATLWNLSLIIGAFALTTFGTFLTRGSVLSSVHAFAESAVGPMYLGFLLLVLLTGFGLVAWRMPLLRSPARLDSLLTRDAAIIGNNVLLLALTGIILLGTVFPLLVEAVSGDRISIGRPYFEDAVAPVGLLLLLLLATGPLLPWRTGNPRRTVARLRWPVAAGALVMAGCAIAGARSASVVAGFGLTAAVVVANGGELVSGLRTGRGGRGRLGRLRRGAVRYGGLLVHVGLGVLAAGVIASAALGTQTELTLAEGESGSFAGYQVRYDGMSTSEQPQRTVLTTALTVTRTGQHSSLRPRLNLYPAASEPIGTPAIDRGPVWDLYASTLALQDQGGSATFRLYHTPGVTCLWSGALVMALGGLLAAWPRRRPRPAGGELHPAVGTEPELVGTVP